MKVLSRLLLAGACALLLAPVSVSYAQDTILENWNIKPNRITAQTCMENIKKCGLLDPDEDTVVSELSVRAIGGRDMRIDYCAKVQDPVPVGAKCEAVVNGNVAAPGGLRLSKLDTDYSKCLSWFATAKGKGRRSNSVVIQCKAEGGDPGDVDISESATSVFHQ